MVSAEQWIAGSIFTFFSGSHTGYRRLADPVIHRRMIFSLHGEYWLVAEYFPRPRAADLGLTADDVGRTIAARDRGDAEQLAPAADAHVIDTSGLTVSETMDAIVRLVEAAA